MPDFVNYDNTDIESNLLVDNNSPGLMSSDDKKKLNGLPGVWYGSEKEYDNLETKDSNVLYIIKPLTTYLISGSEFNKEIANVGAGDGTNVVFTNYKIPSDKISTATVVSTYDSEAKAYMYLDGDTIYVSPEEDNTTIYANENCSTMFYYYQFISSIDFSNFDTSKVTNMSNMFYNCKSLTSITGIENFNTSKIKHMQLMFEGCESLTSLDLSNWDTSTLYNTASMFNNCTSLTSLDLSKFDMSKVSDMTGMFGNCESLTSINGLERFNLSAATTTVAMFNGCSKLSGEITINSNPYMGYADMFANCSTNAGSKFTVNYKSGCQTVAQEMVNTRSSNSNVILGVQV